MFTEYCVRTCVYIYMLNTNVLSTFRSQFLTFTCPQLGNEDIWCSNSKQHRWLMFSGHIGQGGSLLFPAQCTQRLVSGLVQGDVSQQKACRQVSKYSSALKTQREKHMPSPAGCIRLPGACIHLHSPAGHSSAASTSTPGARSPRTLLRDQCKIPAAHGAPPATRVTDTSAPSADSGFLSVPNRTVETDLYSSPKASLH